MYTNKNVFIFFFGLYFAFASFVNAKEQHRIDISVQKCENIGLKKQDGKIIFSAKNLMNVNYTKLWYQVVIKDNDGNIHSKSHLDFGRLKPNGEAFATIPILGVNCAEVTDVQIVHAVDIQIDGERTSEKIKSLIVDNTNLKFDVEKLVAGGSKSSESANKSNSNNNLKKYKAGLEYSWAPSNDNASCKPSDKKICLTSQEYKDICEVAAGISKQGINWRATFASGEEKKLLQGGSYEDIRVLWAQSQLGKEQCYGVITASGIVNGNSTRMEIQGVVKTFMVDDNGKILVTAFDLW